MKLGYIRVSTTDQHTDRQLEGVQLDKIFEDKASGKNTDRPALKELLAYARQGDTVHIHSIDRLARSLIDLQNLLADFRASGVNVAFHSEGLTFKADSEADPCATLMFQLLGAFAQFERSCIKTRQREGIEKAKERGAYANHGGSKPKLTDQECLKALEMKNQGVKLVRIAQELGITRPTLNAALKRATALAEKTA